MDRHSLVLRLYRLYRGLVLTITVTAHARLNATPTLRKVRFRSESCSTYLARFACREHRSPKYGRGEPTGVGGWLRGRRLDTGPGLYQMMPLNGRVRLEEKLKGFSGSPEIQVMERKHDTDPLRFEQRTPGFTLMNSNAGYRGQHLRVEAGGSNLLNRWYYLPLGGVNFDDFSGEWLDGPNPAPHRRRAVILCGYERPVLSLSWPTGAAP